MPTANCTVSCILPVADGSAADWPELTGLIEPVSVVMAKANVDMLRLDRLHPHISGNKAFKLAGFLPYFRASSKRALLSFGGPYSNHLHALAALGQALDIPVIAVVRGYAHLPLTATLQDCQAWGAELIFADKKTYARRYDRQWQQELAQHYDAFVIPEGGAGEAGEQECRRLATLCNDYDQIWLAVGTGTTAVGVAQGLQALSIDCELIGVNAVADQGERLRLWQQVMPAGVRWRLLDNAHLGGFGRVSAELLALIQRYDRQHLPLDPVYTAKMMLAFEQALSAESQATESRTARILLVHSGGLQGRRGYSL
ncbi:MAG: pyridoxal-phosphate dependent enzyme [Saccharospirillaceae bacterium]|nr:pyridoxal-phosphate dependent enzyme [Saccharospirillaceae bacterium]MCD8530680.1 pyridoxal-phosphate dependent enzyme [Saccharospirillaceae bacterium]